MISLLQRSVLKRLYWGADGPEGMTRATRERLVDMAYRIDEEFASTLASVQDDDPAKAAKKKELLERLDWNRLKRKLIEDDAAMPGSATERERWVDAIEVLHGQLNAGRLVSKRAEEMMPYLASAATLPLREAYVIYSWVLANMKRKYAESQHAEKFLLPVCDAIINAAELADRVAAGAVRRSTISFAREVGSSGSVLRVREGERDKAISFLKNWLEREKSERITICDPYFGPADLDVLLTIWNVTPEAHITIITGRAHCDKECAGDSIERFFRKYWSSKISEQEAENCSIVVVGSRDTGEPPFHDRCWLTSVAGLRIGSSFGSLGFGKTCEISMMDDAAFAQAVEECERYESHSLRVWKDQRVDYSVFTL